MNGVRQEVNVGDIDTGGGDVSLSPIINYNDRSEPQQRWRQALLRGPVAALQLEGELHQARELQETGDSHSAAVTLVDLARQVDRAGYQSSADHLLFEAAAQVAQHSRQEAEEQQLEVARRQLDRADPHVRGLVHRLSHETEHLPAALTGLLYALNTSQCPDSEDVRAGCAAVTGRADEGWWRARLTEVAYLSGETDLAIEVARPLRETQPLAGGDRLLMEVDALAGEEARDGAEAVEEQWEALLAWADEPSTEPEDRGLAHQRRGTVLAYRDQLDGACAAYVTAARAFAELPDGQEQAATALFSQRCATFLLGDPAQGANDVTVAVGLRGRTQSPAAIGDRLTLIALHRLTDRSFREALLNGLRALRVRHRAGDLDGTIEAFHVLGRINEATADSDDGREHDRLAALYYAVRAGEHKGAAEQALRLTSLNELATYLSLGGPRWERAASYAALKGRGQQIAEPQYSAIAEQVVAEAELPPHSVYGNDVRRLARQALARFPFVPDAHLRFRVLRMLERVAVEGTLDDRHSARVALRQAHEAGLGNYGQLLLRDYLSDVPSPAVNYQTADAIFADEHSKQQLIDAAHDGRRAALEALSASGEAANHSVLVELCDAQVEGTLEMETHSPGRYKRMRFASIGLHGAIVDEPLRKQLARKLVQLLGDGDDMRSNRMEALAALSHLADYLAPDEAGAAFDAVVSIARGDAPPSDYDSDADASRHPLQSLRRYEPQADEMVALAVQVAADLANASGSKTAQLQQIVDPALHAASPRIRAAGLVVLAEQPDLAMPSRVWQTEDRRETAAQLQLQLARHGLPDVADLEYVFDSPEFVVRRVLLNAAEESDPRRTDVLQQFVERDPDAYLRAIARRLVND